MELGVQRRCWWDAIKKASIQQWTPRPLVEHLREQERHNVTVISSGGQNMKFMFGLQHPLTCKPWTTLSKPCNKVRGKYICKVVFLCLPSCVFILRRLFLRLSFCVRLSLLLLSRYDTANEYTTEWLYSSVKEPTFDMLSIQMRMVSLNSRRLSSAEIPLMNRFLHYRVFGSRDDDKFLLPPSIPKRQELDKDKD